MLTLETEVAALAMADRHLRDGYARLTAQSHLIETLHAGGHDTALAQALPVQMELMLSTWRQHRILIQEAVDRLSGPQQPSKSGLFPHSG